MFKEKIISSNWKKSLSLFIVCLLVGLSSFFVGADFFSSPDTYSKTIQSLDAKKMTATALTGTAAIASTALSAVPGDTTSPIANKIADLSSSLYVVVSAIYLEKFLLTAIGLVSFKFIIPFACLIGIINLFINSKELNFISIRLTIFALIIVSIIPASVKLGDLMYETHQASIEQALNSTIETNTENNSIADNTDESFWDKI